MDLHSFLRQEMHTPKVYSFDEYREEAEEDDDDVFYDELRRQVLQLTADDEEVNDEDVCENKVVINTMEARKQGSCNGQFGVPLPRCYYNWPGIMEDCVVAPPLWMLNLWRSGNGTGVFIPQMVHSRRRNRSRRNKNERGRTYKRVEKMRMT